MMTPTRELLGLLQASAWRCRRHFFTGLAFGLGLVPPEPGSMISLVSHSSPLRLS